MLVAHQHADNTILQDDDIKQKYECIQTFVGVGNVTAQTLVLDLPELGQLKKTEISRLIGVAPINNDSGLKAGHRYIQGGRAHIRRTLYMAALVATRYNATMRAFYQRLRDAGKPAKVAIVAVMRKIIIVLNAMVRDQKPWQSVKELTTQNA